MTVFMTPPEAAELLGVDETTVRRWHDKGLIAGQRNPLTGRRLLERASVEALAEHPSATNNSNT